MRGTAESFRVFVRNWWRWDAAPFSGSRVKVPDAGARKTTLARGCTEEEARALCASYAAKHKPGPLSRKAEYERE
jgi:hypothetical protein